MCADIAHVAACVELASTDEHARADHGRRAPHQRKQQHKTRVLVLDATFGVVNFLISHVSPSISLLSFSIVKSSSARILRSERPKSHQHTSGPGHAPTHALTLCPSLLYCNFVFVYLYQIA